MPSYHVDGLAAAKACATPGLCIFCEEELPPPKPRQGRPRIVCGSPGCKTSYIAAYVRDRRRGAPRVYTPAHWRIRWHCECGRSYCNDRFRYDHRHRCLFAAQAWPVVVVPARRAA